MLRIVTTNAFKNIVNEISKKAETGRFLNEADISLDTIKSDVKQEKEKEKEKDKTTDKNPKEIDTKADDITRTDIEKAKYEKEAAENELKQYSYIKLNSDAGVGYLLDTILSDALNKNTIDTLAQDFVSKLKIDDENAFNLFVTETSKFRKIKGFNQMVKSMKNFLPNNTTDQK